MPVTVRSFGKTTSRNFSSAFFSSTPFAFSRFLISSRICPRFPGEYTVSLSPTRMRKMRARSLQHGGFAIEIQLTFFYELPNRNHSLFLSRVDSADHRRQALVLEFDNDRALHERRTRDHVWGVVDLLLQRPPVAHNVLAFHENVRVEVDYLLPQLAIETGHHRNHENEHSHAERNADDRDQGDDGKKGTFRFEITQREKKTERQFQVAVMLAAN